MTGLTQYAFAITNICPWCFKKSSNDIIEKPCSECGKDSSEVLHMLAMFIPVENIDKINSRNPGLNLDKEFVQ